MSPREGLFSSGSSNRFSCFFVRSPSPFGFTLVPELLAFSQRKFNLYSAVLEVHSRWDESQAFLLGLADQLTELFFMHQEFPRAQGSMVVDVAMFVGADMAVQEPEFAVFDQAVGVLQVDLAATDRLDLRTS